MKEKIVVSIDGSCQVNPHGEMKFAYIIDHPNGEPETHFEIIDSKYGNTMCTAEYMALNSALDRLKELNMTMNDIEVRTTSSQINLHLLGLIKPNRGYYLKEAIETSKNIRKFLSIKVNKILRKDNVEVLNLYKS